MLLTSLFRAAKNGLSIKCLLPGLCGLCKFTELNVTAKVYTTPTLTFSRCVGSKTAKSGVSETCYRSSVSVRICLHNQPKFDGKLA